MTAGKAFRIRRQDQYGESLHVPNTNACRCCYRPLEHAPKAHYCDERCQEAHQRLRGAA